MITYHDGRLVLDFKQAPAMSGELKHCQYDTFRVDWGDPLIELAHVTFMLQAEGGIGRIGMRPVSPLADSSFDYGDLDFKLAARK